jgi:hypothetical protein
LVVFTDIVNELGLFHDPIRGRHQWFQSLDVSHPGLFLRLVSRIVFEEGDYFMIPLGGGYNGFNPLDASHPGLFYAQTCSNVVWPA